MAFIPLAIFLWPAALGGDTQFLLVQGQSMLGTIEPGSFVVLKAQEKYEEGDIIGYASEKQSSFAGRNVVHRIIEEKPDGFILQGDNNPKPDPNIVRNDQIMGEVIFFTPFLGYVLLIMRNPLVMVVLAIATFMMQFGRKKKKNKDYVLFVPALVITLAAYLIIQVSFEAGINEPKADPLTTMLYGVAEPYLASTISFALYFLLLLGLYYIAKTQDTIPRKILPSGGVMTLQKKTNLSLAVARLTWLSFILSGIYFLFLMTQDLQAEFG